MSHTNTNTSTRKKPAKPRSVLQRAHSKLQWVVNFRLQHFAYGETEGIDNSIRTLKLMHDRNLITLALKESLRADYAAQKEKLTKLKKEFDNSLP